MVLEHYIRQYTREFEQSDRDVWNYEDGCVLIGLEALYRATGEEPYAAAMQTFIDRYIDSSGSIRMYRMEDHNLDFIPSGRVLFLLLQKTQNPKYRAAIENLMQQLHNQPRTLCGSFWHKAIYPHQVWLDGLYMAMPFLMLYANQFGVGGIYADVLHQFANVRQHLYEPKVGLYYHAWDESKAAFWADKKTGLSPNFWSRGIGWYLLALSDVYELWPEEHPGRDTLKNLWTEAMEGMLSHRDQKTGLFYQLTSLSEVEGNYLETSASLMVSASLYKGVRLGVFPEEDYLKAAEDVLFSVVTRQMSMENGMLHLGGICKGAGLGPEGNYRRDGSIAYYLSEDVVQDEQKGVGVLLMAVAQRLLLNAARLIPSDHPRVEIFNQEYDLIMPDEVARR